MPQISGNKAEKLQNWLRIAQIVNDVDEDDDKLEEAEKLFKVFAEPASKK